MYAEELKKKKQKREEEHQRERDLLEEQRKRDDQAMKMQFKDNSDIYRKINSIVVEWGQDALYDEDMITMLFEGYGPIKSLVINIEKRTAQIQFFQTISAEKAFIDNQNQTDLSVQYLKKQEKRKKYIEKLGMQKKQQKTDMSLSS